MRRDTQREWNVCCSADRRVGSRAQLAAAAAHKGRRATPARPTLSHRAQLAASSGPSTARPRLCALRQHPPTAYERLQTAGGVSKVACSRAHQRRERACWRADTADTPSRRFCLCRYSNLSWCLCSRTVTAFQCECCRFGRGECGCRGRRVGWGNAADPRSRHSQMTFILSAFPQLALHLLLHLILRLYILSSLFTELHFITLSIPFLCTIQ